LVQVWYEYQIVTVDHAECECSASPDSEEHGHRVAMNLDYYPIRSCRLPKIIVENIVIKT